MLDKGCISDFLKSKLWLWQNMMAHGTCTDVTYNFNGKNYSSTEIHNMKTKKKLISFKKETCKRYGWWFHPILQDRVRMAHKYWSILTEVLNKQMQWLLHCIHLLISLHCLPKLTIQNLLSVFCTVQARKAFNGPHEFTVYLPCLTEVRNFDAVML